MDPTPLLKKKSPYSCVEDLKVSLCTKTSRNANNRPPIINKKLNIFYIVCPRIIFFFTMKALNINRIPGPIISIKLFSNSNFSRDIFD